MFFNLIGFMFEDVLLGNGCRLFEGCMFGLFDGVIKEFFEWVVVIEDGE